MDKETDYAKQQAEKHKRKIILPTCISWEYGSNKFASQKGQSAFGTIRNTKLNNDSDVQYWKKNNVVHYVYEQVPEGSKISHGEQQNTNFLPKFESHDNVNDEETQYKAWIGGQTTTFTPAEGLDKK